MYQDLKIGMLGGGQLGAMLIRHAIDYGLSISVMDDNAQAPCKRYTADFTCADPLDYDAVLAFGKGLDIITLEKEAVNVAALKQLATDGVRIYPSPHIIEIIQDKYTQKQFLEAHQIPVAPGIAIEDLAHLKQISADKLPGCLKKRRNGYDGKGVMIVRNQDDLATAFDEPCVLEELIAIRHELAVIVARNIHGEILCYEPVLMVVNNERMLLDYQLCPAGMDAALNKQAEEMAIKIADALQLNGIVAVEMFLTEDGRLLVNELAPRPHNSGHHTIEASTTSQYEQLIRAFLDLPLGDTHMHSASVMVNMIAPAEDGEKKTAEVLSILATKDAHLHWYGKGKSTPGRKMGHINIIAEDTEAAIAKAASIRELLNTHYT